MNHLSNRRHFLKSAALAGAGVWLPSRSALSAPTLANETIQFGCIGVGGKGISDSNDADRHGQVVAICDIDEQSLSAAAGRFPGARKFIDFREMLDQMGEQIDAVTVSTPDHTHAAASVMAMRRGKHCFCQKPLTRTIHEARAMREVARQNKLATQMGNQATASDALRQVVALVREGIVGTVREVHVWTDRAGGYWKNGLPRPQETPPVPAHVDWQQFLGPAPFRPYHPLYHPDQWRAWWDFGTGALGDMGCHTMNAAVMALDLFDPVRVEAATSPNNKDSFPVWSEVTYEFPATDKRPPLTLTWYDGGKLPPMELFQGAKREALGMLLVGDGGTLYAPGDAPGDEGHPTRLLSSEKALPSPKDPLPKSPGHFEEWVRAIRTGEAAMSNFDYASRITETVLLGNLAMWAGRKIQWDAEGMKVPGDSQLDVLIRPEYGNGYAL